MDINTIILMLISGMGAIILVLINMVLSSIKEVRAEIEVLKHLETRIAVLESKVNK